MHLSLHRSWAPNHGTIHVTEHPVLRWKDRIAKCGWHWLQVCVGVWRLCHRHPLIAHELARWIWCEQSRPVLTSRWQWQAHLRPSAHKLNTGSITCGWYCHQWGAAGFGGQRDTGAATTATTATTDATSSTVSWLDIGGGSTTISSWYI